MVRTIFLSPLTLLFHWITSTRNKLYDSRVFQQRRASLPVISIGNVSVGGNGKTPLCIYVARKLRERGYRPVILTRGYGGNVRGPHVVTVKDAAQRVGDEALELFQESGAPVVICRRRVRGARFVAHQQLGDVLLLDDGFQHRALARDIDLITEYVGDDQAIERFCRGTLMPFGRFREDRDRALRRADLLVFAYRSPITIGEPLDPRLLRDLPGHLRVFRSSVQAGGVQLRGGGALLEPQAVGAFCAIAQPESFFSTLRSLGFRIEGVEVFPDHHRFTAAELQRIAKRFSGLPLVCTGKDAVKLPSGIETPIGVLRINTEVSPADAFIVQICRAILEGQKRNRTIQFPGAKVVGDEKVG